MSKLTKPNLDYKLLDLSKGNNVKCINNFTWWLLRYVPHYKSLTITNYLLANGIEFNTENLDSEIWDYLPPKRSIGLSLEQYSKRLYDIYLQNYRKDKLSEKEVKRNVVTKHDKKILCQWVQDIPKLKKYKNTSLRNLAYFHPDGNIIYKAKNSAFNQYLKEQADGVKYDQSTLFIDAQESSDAVIDFTQNTLDTLVTHAELCAQSDKEIYELRAEVKELRAEVKELRAEKIDLRAEVEQIKNFLDIKVKDLLRAVK